MAEQTTLAPGEGEPSTVGGDGEVASGDELAASRSGERMHLGDDHLRNGLHRIHHLGAHLEQLAGLFDRGTGGGYRQRITFV